MDDSIEAGDKTWPTLEHSHGLVLSNFHMTDFMGTPKKVSYKESALYKKMRYLSNLRKFLNGIWNKSAQERGPLFRVVHYKEVRK